MTVIFEFCPTILFSIFFTCFIVLVRVVSFFASLIYYFVFICIPDKNLRKEEKMFYNLIMFSFGFWWLWNYSWHFKGVYNGVISTAENWLTTTNAVHTFSLQNKCRLTIASYCLCFTLWKMCIKKFVLCCSLPHPQPPCCSKYQIDRQLLTAQPPEHGPHHHFTLTTMCSSHSTRPRLVSPLAPQLWENLCCSSQDSTAYPLIWKNKEYVMPSFSIHTWSWSCRFKNVCIQ